MPLQDVYERTFDEDVPLPQDDEGHAEEQDDQPDAHSAGVNNGMTEVES